jgi:hypothetical protein
LDHAYLIHDYEIYALMRKNVIEAFQVEGQHGKNNEEPILDERHHPSMEDIG